VWLQRGADLCLNSPVLKLDIVIDMSLAGIAEVISLVTGLGGDEAAGRQEVTGPTDPLRVVISHTLQPAARSVSFTVELLNRLTADIKGLVLR